MFFPALPTLYTTKQAEPFLKFFQNSNHIKLRRLLHLQNVRRGLRLLPHVNWAALKRNAHHRDPTECWNAFGYNGEVVEMWVRSIFITKLHDFSQREGQGCENGFECIDRGLLGLGSERENTGMLVECKFDQVALSG